MSDILVYSATTEKARLEQLKESLGSSALNLEDSQITVEGITGPTFLGSATPYYVPVDGGRKPSDIGAQWCGIFGDLAASKSFGIQVCDTTNYKRCGSTCTFTVPAGVERITYQMWGAGTGSATICCCGGSPYGTNGSFAIGEFDVVAGDIICMNAACAYCCYADGTSTPGQAVSATCLRHVSGANCFTICAPSGPTPQVCRWHCALTEQGLSPYPSCQLWMPALDKTSCTMGFCGGCWQFCWDATDDSGFVPMAYDPFCIPSFTGQSNFDAKNATLYGIPAMWGEMSVGTNWCNDPNSYLLNAPVFGFPNINCKADMNISTCCPGCCFRACTGIQSAPGIGGFPSRMISGGGGCYGDAGGMGMICLSYNCV